MRIHENVPRSQQQPARRTASLASRAQLHAEQQRHTALSPEEGTKIEAWNDEQGFVDSP